MLFQTVRFAKKPYIDVLLTKVAAMKLIIGSGELFMVPGYFLYYRSRPFLVLPLPYDVNIKNDMVKLLS